MKERLKPVIEASAALGIAYFASRWAFSTALKKRVRWEQHGQCDCCPTVPRKLQIHHKIPQSMGGSDTRDNAVGLCPDCHEYFDKLALEAGIFYDED